MEVKGQARAELLAEMEATLNCAGTGSGHHPLCLLLERLSSLNLGPAVASLRNISSLHPRRQNLASTFLYPNWEQSSLQIAERFNSTTVGENFLIDIWNLKQLCLMIFFLSFSISTVKFKKKSDFTSLQESRGFRCKKQMPPSVSLSNTRILFLVHTLVFWFVRKNPDTDGMCFRICRREKSRHPYAGGISTYTTSVFFKAYKAKDEAPMAATDMINAKGMS